MGQGPRAGFLTALLARYEAFGCEFDGCRLCSSLAGYQAFGSELDGCRVRSSLGGYEAFGSEFDGCRVWVLHIAKVG